MEKQKFNKRDLEKFKKYLKIKENPGELENELIKKTIKYLNYIKLIPWIRMVWIWNSVSMNSATKESDIDLFIITSENRMWIVRILITVLFQILWVRKNKKHHSSRFCLSFFSTISWMNFKNFALKDDIYLYFWIVYLKPILDFNDTYKDFIEKNHSWAVFWSYEKILEENKKYIKIKWKCWWNKSKLLNYIEVAIKNLFLKKTLTTYEKIWKPFWIIINDNMLKFHNSDIRKEIKQELKKE